MTKQEIKDILEESSLFNDEEVEEILHHILHFTLGHVILFARANYQIWGNDIDTLINTAISYKTDGLLD